MSLSASIPTQSAQERIPNDVDDEKQTVQASQMSLQNGSNNQNKSSHTQSPNSSIEQHQHPLCAIVIGMAGSG